jgi:hypothetical protein
MTWISNIKFDLNDDNEVDYFKSDRNRRRKRARSNRSIGFGKMFTKMYDYWHRKRNNKIQVQIVGNEYMYGPNYIYEPVYTVLLFMPLLVIQSPMCLTGIGITIRAINCLESLSCI